MAREENAPNKPVHLIYICGAITLFFLLQWTIDWVWGMVGRPPSEFLITMVAGVVAFGAAIVFYRNERSRGMITEIANELAKVTWPTAKEVRAATIVVIVMAVVSAAVIALFDFVWSNLTRLIYGA